MGIVPYSYYQFVIDYAPYVYVIPGTGPDLSVGKAALAAAFAIDFLAEAYNKTQFQSKQTEIFNKVVSLSDWLLTQQYTTDPSRKAYGGFKSTETSTYYYSIDAARAIPALIKAYQLTGTEAYLNAAKLAGSTYLYNMQHPPTPTVHDKYYGGFARAVTDADVWLPEMDIENLYVLMGLRLLVEHDVANKDQYEVIMADVVDFLRSGLENLYLEYRAPPSGDGNWHRIGLAESQIYDDSFAYALLGLYDYEGWSPTVQKVYTFINAIKASAEHPAYDPAACWAGYIDVVSRVPACNYYDAVTAGILWRIRKHYDKSSLEFNVKTIDKHQEAFMFWGVKHSDYTSVENKQAMAAVCWLAQLFLYYEDAMTRFTQILRATGENVTLYPIREVSNVVSYGEGIDIQAVVSLAKIEEIVIEPGYIVNDYLVIHVFAPMRHHDKIRRKGVDYEVLDIQEYDFQGETMCRRAVCRRMLNA